MKTAKAICKTNAAIMDTERSFPIKDLRFKATKLAEAAPVRIIIIHRRISNGISNRNWKFHEKQVLDKTHER
jgi:hypothetical protein